MHSSSNKYTYKEAVSLYINERNHRLSTERVFVCIVENFFDKVDSIYPDDIDKKTVLKWRRNRLAEISATTLNSNIGYLNSFYAFCIENCLVKSRVNPFKGMRVKTKIGGDRSINIDHIERVFNYFDKDEYIFNGESSLFWKTFTMTLYHTGMRVSQLLNLTCNDINIDAGWILMRAEFSKNYHEYKVPISDDLQASLYEYKKRFNPSKGQFFNTLFYKGVPLGHRRSIKTTDSEVFNFYKKLSDTLGFRITTHMFRHTLATDIIRKTGNVIFAQKILGHLCVNSTAKYTHVDIDELRDMLNEMVRPES